MNREFYFQYIVERLCTLAFRIESCGKLNLHDLNLHSENFYQQFFNRLFHWQLQNINKVKPNAEAIDLVDRKNRIIIQVSSTATKQKIETALGRNLLTYVGYGFKFISISKGAEKLRKCEFANPNKLNFIPEDDIYDIDSILNEIIDLDIDELKLIYNFIKNELGREFEPQRIETNLAAIITILAKEDWNQNITDIQINPFEIDRKIEYNDLIEGKNIIEDYKIHYGQVDKIYSEFDNQGVNKSKSVLDSIRNDYLKNKKYLSGDALFSKIISIVIDRIQSSINYVPIPYDELELCVRILVVDTFMRCKIFENPEGYTLVTS